MFPSDRTRYNRMRSQSVVRNLIAHFASYLISCVTFMYSYNCLFSCRSRVQQIIISSQNKKRSNQIILFVILFPTPLWCTQICSLQPMPQPICANLNLRKAGKAASIRREAKLIVVVPRGGNVIYSTVKKWAAIYLPLAYISSQWCLSCHLVSATYRWVQLLFFLLFYSKMVHRSADGCRYSTLEVEQI